MKKILLSLLTLTIFLGNLYAQQSTTPPHVQSVQTWAGKTDAALYYAGAWYVGVNTPTGATIYRYNSNSTVDTLMTVQSKDSYPSGFISKKNNIFTITNNKLYIHAYVGGNENAVLMYDLSTGVSDFEKRLSFEGESMQSITSYNGDIYVTVSYVSSIYRVAQGANWTNSIDTYSGSGNPETSLIKLDAAMNPSLVRHFNHASYDYGSINNGTSLAGNGFLLNFNSGRFERITLDGTTTHSLYLGEDARMKLGMNGNYIISKKKSAELRDANWALLKTVGKISYDDLNNVTVSGNDYMFSVGLPNFFINSDDGKQEWAFYFYDADLNFKYKKSGVKLEYFFGIEPQVKNFQIFDLSSSGYRKLGFYYAVPHIGTTIGPLVQLAGNDLPAATNSSPMTVSYYRSMSVPTEQITIQLGSSGKDLYLNKKIVNGTIIDADQFSAVIVTQNTDLEALVGSQVPVTIATFTAPAGWSIWKDPSNTLAEWNKLYIQKDANGDYFVNIPMYDSTSDSYWVNAESGITTEVNKKIYLQNVTVSDTDGDGVYDTNDLCPATPLGEVVDTNGCSQSQLDDDNDGVMNNLDLCPNTATGETVDANGCSAAQTDTDGDGVYDTNDLCPATPVGETVDANGCSQSQLDDDNDGVMNNLDLCPNTAAGETVDENGCSDSQLTADDDNDGISNLNDDCPNTPTNDIVNTSGCSIINIPDVNFEQALIDLGFDSDGIINQQILSSDATVVTNLNLYGKNINDLTGIEGFNNLTTLLCGNNNLTYLNISQNTKLVDLQCNTNSLTSLDVSNNIALTKLFCAYNQITNLNVTNNILLEQLDCSVNQITSLDITNNSLLTVFSCHTNNPLNSLNIKNGNNTSIITFYANLNPNLTCITVDNVDWSTLNWTAIDSQTSYSENCGNNDTDGDGVYDTNDLCPATPDGEAVDTNGCSQSQLDDDNDGVVNSLDQCPNTPSGETVDVNGCSQSQIDDDGDGIMNDVDTCADTPTGEAVDTNGCSQSQLDDDNDGVVNSLDTCPDTPSGETVNVNGCSQSQIDDDGDGVVNSLDTCPNTPSGETVDVNGCSQSQIDDDGDGIMNDVDTCADTPTGEEVNATGCSQSQLDDDNDGVMNNLDQCPNTPTGETVDANGCILLASDNFTIEIISETCPNKNNGRIIISAQLSYNYIATINGADYDFTTNLTVDNLSPGNYEICIIVTNQTSPYCYNIVILEGTTISGKASVTTNKAAIEITQGTPPYIVLINGKEQLQTVSPLFTIDVKHGDLLEVKTGVACEGIFSKTIDLFEVITAYPNPTSGIFEIALPMSLKEIKIELFTTNNQLISSKTYSVINGKVQLNIENMPVAVYFAKVHLNKPVTLKIIKQ